MVTGGVLIIYLIPPKALPGSSHAVQGPLGKKLTSHILLPAPSPASSCSFHLTSEHLRLSLSPTPFDLSSLVKGNSDYLFHKITFSQYKEKIKSPFCFLFVFSFFISILLLYHKKSARHQHRVCIQPF